MTITKERLEQYAFDDRMCNINDEIREMARMALAGMEAEPVAQVLSSRAGNDTSTIDKALPEGTMLYTAPQPLTTSERAELENYRNAQQVVPDASVMADNHISWLNENFPRKTFTDEEWEEVSLYTWLAWRDACRAAMLQGKADGTLIGEGTRNHPEDNLDMVDHSGDANENGNSPAVPDGWVACSERMPHIGVPVITCRGDVVQYAAYAWDGKEWQDWYEEYDKLPANTFTHWHSRPAAPQQEAE